MGLDLNASCKLSWIRDGWETPGRVLWCIYNMRLGYDGLWAMRHTQRNAKVKQ